jgi:hypothetical protein
MQFGTYRRLQEVFLETLQMIFLKNNAILLYENPAAHKLMRQNDSCQLPWLSRLIDYTVGDNKNCWNHAW